MRTCQAFTDARCTCRSINPGTRIILLLDEPTNHLDLPSVLWLAKYLQSYKRPFVIVSHDRTLLNGLVTSVIHIQKWPRHRYSGNFDVFIAEYRMRQSKRLKLIRIWIENIK